LPTSQNPVAVSTEATPSACTSTIFQAGLTPTVLGGVGVCGGSSPQPQPSNLIAGSGLQVVSGFSITMIANFGARELTMLPNGDLLAGTQGQSIMIVPNAEGAAPGASQTFITLNDSNAEGVTYGPDGNIYVATMHYLWKIPYTSGQQSAPASSAQVIATYRQGGIPPGSDGDEHNNSSVAINGSTIYVGVGSSCNSCIEIDPTRATIQSLSLGAPGPLTEVAKRIRNPLAMTIDPATGVLWAGGPGQDDLPYGHPYEYMDPVTLHAAPADYGWPVCEEDNNPFNSGANCVGTVAPLIEFPAYATHISSVFYPSNKTGAFVFPAAYRGGLFVASHGSWHCCPSTIPKVEFVAMNNDTPVTPVIWSDPTTQWSTFLYDTRTSTSHTTYVERFTGLTVGTQGSLFIGDDNKPGIYRVRPSTP
jgi:glucose/arabinose dehydrogenase